MASLIELVNGISLKNRFSGFPSSDDLKHDILAALWDEQLPNELCDLFYPELLKIKSRLAKREERYLKKNVRSTEFVSQQAANSAAVQTLNLEEFGITPSNEFEKDVVLVESGLHQDFETIAEFANSKRHCGRAEVYKRRKQFYQRLEKQRDTICA